GFLDESRLYSGPKGTLFYLGENAGLNSGGSAVKMVYKSTDNGNTFIPDTIGMGEMDVSQFVFNVDESGVQHASARVSDGGGQKRVWQKKPGLPWELDTMGLPQNMDF